MALFAEPVVRVRVVPLAVLAVLVFKRAQLQKVKKVPPYLLQRLLVREYVGVAHRARGLVAPAALARIGVRHYATRVLVVFKRVFWATPPVRTQTVRFVVVFAPFKPVV